MNNVFLVIFCIILFIPLIIQIALIVKEISEHEKCKIDYNCYSDNVLEKAEKIFNDLNNGIIKKHIITNSAKPYNSKRALNEYRKFLCSSMMLCVNNLDEDSKYYG